MSSPEDVSRVKTALPEDLGSRQEANALHPWCGRTIRIECKHVKATTAIKIMQFLALGLFISSCGAYLVGLNEKDIRNFDPVAYKAVSLTGALATGTIFIALSIARAKLQQ